MLTSVVVTVVAAGGVITGVVSASSRSDAHETRSGSSAGQSGAGTGKAPAWRIGTRIFAADSPWNSPIPADAPLDPRSAAVQRQVLRNPSLVVNTAVYAYGIPFYTATASTPMVRLKGRGAIGTPVPIDPSWKPNDGGDRKMNVIDPVRGLVYELQGYEPAKRTVYWMVVRDIVSGSGDGSSSNGRRGPTGSGLTQAGGVIRVDEIRNGRIEHALSFITSNPAAGRFRYPATHSDGTSTASGAIEEGMRIQLDPDLDLTTLGLSKAERAIARALQVYGAYCTDTGAGNNMAMGFYVEKPTAATGDPYPSAGLNEDWAQLKGIPRSAYRVLAASVTRP